MRKKSFHFGKHRELPDTLTVAAEFPHERRLPGGSQHSFGGGYFVMQHATAAQAARGANQRRVK